MVKKRLVLQIDHIDNDPLNNKQGNLRFLCPNCHSQTNLYSTGWKSKMNSTMFCDFCKKEFIRSKNSECILTRKYIYCSKNCLKIGSLKFSIESRIKKYGTIIRTPKSGLKYKTEWPAPNILKKLVWEKPILLIAKNLNVSDRAVSKHCEKLKIKTPQSGYWSKIHNKMHQSTGCDSNTHFSDPKSDDSTVGLPVGLFMV